MIANLDEIEQMARPELPLDLREWVSEEVLTEWIDEAVEAFDWNQAELRQQLRERPDYRPKLMLRLLAFAYTSGRLETADILHGCLCDPAMRTLSEEEPPTPEQIVQFTNECRAQLKWVLLHVLTRAALRYLKTNSKTLPPGWRRWAEDNAFVRVQLARHMNQQDGA